MPHFRRACRSFLNGIRCPRVTPDNRDSAGHFPDNCHRVADAHDLRGHDPVTHDAATHDV
ncbi:hypothetical protein ACIBO4_14410 [Streptomyces sp. NPDC050149]|uniref:hypothetical protein n=1 Tax=Streptomyces sp. NPDC050149 TaxID=3365603 RepID=UPI0037A70C21